MRQIRNSNYFRSLNGKEEEAVFINDNRILTEDENRPPPNNKLLIICEHASNDVKYSKITEEEKAFLNSNDAMDVGAMEVANELSERTKCMTIFANFSKLIIDPSKPLVS